MSSVGADINSAVWKVVDEVVYGQVRDFDVASFPRQNVTDAAGDNVGRSIESAFYAVIEDVMKELS